MTEGNKMFPDELRTLSNCSIKLTALVTKSVEPH